MESKGNQTRVRRAESQPQIRYPITPFPKSFYYCNSADISLVCEGPFELCRGFFDVTMLVNEALRAVHHLHHREPAGLRESSPPGEDVGPWTN